MKMNSKVVRFTKVKILIRKLCTATSKKKKKKGVRKDEGKKHFNANSDTQVEGAPLPR